MASAAIMAAAAAMASPAGALSVPPVPGSPLPPGILPVPPGSLPGTPGITLPTTQGGPVQPYGANDFRGFRNVLPPGTNGFDNLAELGAFEASKTYPPHSNDQLAMYANLTTAAPNIQPSQVPNFYKDATFGIPPGAAESTEVPEAGVTIVRDKQYAVPHIYGTTRAALMYGIGYATAEDRLFFIDALRHAGRANLAQFAGGANAAMDESVWASEPYTEQDLANQINWGRRQPGGAQIFNDATNYVAGINAYINQAKFPANTLSMMPAEYTALGQPQGPAPFTLEDLVSIATLVGGIFGNGGGAQLSNALLYENLRQRFGPEAHVVAGAPERAGRAVKRRPSARTSGTARPYRTANAARAKARKKQRPAKRKAKPSDRSGFATLMSFVDPSDPEAPTTVRHARFPYQTLPRPTAATLRTIALPDRGSVRFTKTVVSGSVPNAPNGGGKTGATTTSVKTSSSGAPSSIASTMQGLLAFPRAMSNALLVSGAHSRTGHPLAVMGPQVSYFTPEILMEEDIHGPGIDADGAAFPGVNLYVELGHGRDYAWSATSAGQNIIDTFAVPLCRPGGGRPSLSSNDYLLHGRCVPMETLVRQESWTPNPADPTPAGSATLKTQRTAYGIVIARARIHGRAVAYCNLRSTYMHELDSALGFATYNDPAQMRNPQDFFRAANKIGYTFNWFYADDQHIAYFNSGQNPVRARHTDPLFPSWSQFAWPGLHGAANMTPASLTEQDTPASAHPHTIDQTYLTSWNNKQAAAYNDTATGQEYSSIYRSQLLDNNINGYLARGGGKMTLTDLINAMGNAGTQDLRGVEVLPSVLKIIGHPRNRTLAAAVSKLRAWVASGAHRINRAHPGASGLYDQTDAVRLMDAWWPLLVRAEFQPVLGPRLLGQIEGDFPINDEPGHGVSGAHLGSAWDVGFYGIVQKDLRSALHRHVSGPLNRVYCGRGVLARCRSALDRSLLAAARESGSQVYPADSVCQAGDQMCSDSIKFRPIGAITQPLIEWINRPTFQQADEILGHGPR